VPLLILEPPAAAIATMAATNKCLAQSNKSRTGGKATKKREIRQPGLIRWAQPSIRPYPRVR
jgi:hypothetical protein